MTGVPEIRTDRLVMRGWRGDDFEPYMRIAQDPLVAESLGKPEPPKPAEVWRDMAFLSGHWQLLGFGHWVLEEAETRTLVGHAGLLRPPDWPDLEVGWTVGPDHWGKGYAPEAGRAACDWAHDELGARHIVSLIHPDNARSQRVAEKLGETVEGRFQLRQFNLLVYGTDLPLGSRPLRAGSIGPMTENDEHREQRRPSMDTDLGTAEDDLLRREEEAARREAGGIGGQRPEYKDEEGLPADESERVREEAGEGYEEGFEVAEEDLIESASHAENRYDPRDADFGDDESAGNADVLDAEPDQVDVTETVRDPDAGTDDDPGEGPGISHDR